MSERLPGLPGPALTPLTEGYWKAAGQGRLVVQRCSSCGAHQHPPAPACHRCNAVDASEWDELPGTGTVFSFTWADRQVPGFEHLGAYNVAVVELDGTEGDPVRILSAVVDGDRETLAVGLAVSVDFDPVGEGVALPVFRVRAPA